MEHPMTRLRVVPDLIDPVGTDRRERLYEIFGDYINDPYASSTEVYEDLLSEVEGWIKFHSESLEKASDLYSLLLNRGDTKVGMTD